MNDFLTFDALLTYTTFVSIVYMVVEFTKEMKKIKQIPTKYWSFFISFILLIMIHLSMNTFHMKDMILYLLTSIVVSLGSNGLSNFNKRSDLSE